MQAYFIFKFIGRSSNFVCFIEPKIERNRTFYVPLDCKDIIKNQLFALLGTVRKTSQFIEEEIKQKLRRSIFL